MLRIKIRSAAYKATVPVYYLSGLKIMFSVGERVGEWVFVTPSGYSGLFIQN